MKNNTNGLLSSRKDNMKIIVFSDSHTDTHTMAEAVVKEEPDMIFHLGDNAKDAAFLKESFGGIPLFNVIGSTNDSGEGSEEICKDIMGYKILLTHGHQHGVDRDNPATKKLLEYAKSKAADILIYGHSHQAFAFNDSGIWLFNPGRIGKKSSHMIYATYGLLYLSDKSLEWKFVKA